ncbi:YwqJ-related putative deaminase [Streptomyces sp. NPDC052095]|uniref:YwqJ-related putative deaminase n=1 Tax=unclassified Streptomyces TaxID=2593676 RepID=UPI00344D4335
MGGQIVSHTSLVGEGTVTLHPAVRSFVESLPFGVRRLFTGRCAESALVSDQLWSRLLARRRPHDHARRSRTLLRGLRDHLEDDPGPGVPRSWQDHGAVRGLRPATAEARCAGEMA